MPNSSDELFPATPREIYEKAQLVEVVSQLRFPPILRVEAQTPVEFQESIRSTFPLLERATNPISAQLPPGMQLPPEMAQLMGASLGGVGYQFLTEDKSSKVALATGSLSLTTNKYHRWEGFREQFQGPLSALIDIYKPAYFARIGLRYVNAIERSQLGLGNRAWSDLLRKEILGELAVPTFEHNLETCNRTIRVKFPDGSGSVMLRHGLATVAGHGELAYLIDFDLFTEQHTEVSDAQRKLDYFNEMAGRAFRWCISDTLRDALGPRPLDVGLDSVHREASVRERL